jgi:hypothetical protein
MEETILFPFPMDESQSQSQPQPQPQPQPQSQELPNPFIPSPEDVYHQMFPEPPRIIHPERPTITMAMSYQCRLKWETTNHRVRGYGSWFPMTHIRDMEDEAKRMNDKYPTLHHWVETGTTEGIQVIDFLADKIIELYSIKGFTPTPLIVANEDVVDLLFKKGYYAVLNEHRQVLSITKR